MFQYVTKSPPRIDGADKVTGRIQYVNDHVAPGMLHAATKQSSHAHARILSIQTDKAEALIGVHKVVTGNDFPINMGLYLGDKPPLARSKVRHYGEPVAAVIADTLETALKAVELIQVEYDPLPVVHNPLEAIAADAPVIHENMADYNHIDAILPEPGSNIANRTKIRKGSVETVFNSADFTTEESFSFPPGDHVAMEPRGAIAEIKSTGQVVIHSSTQAPFVVRSLMATFFNLDIGKITVTAPPVGGGFGGKAGIQLEGLVYLLSKSVDGRPVKLINSREEDMTSSPGHIGLHASVRLAADSSGHLLAADLTYLFDSGGYADYAVNISRAAAIACTGPYFIPNIRCDSICTYTNHPFATAYRGFGHIELAFAIERSIDILAEKLQLPPDEVRIINAIKPGDTSPTGQEMDLNTGNLTGCIKRVKELINYTAIPETLPDGTIRAQGLGCLWKAPAMPTDTDAGAILTFNEDGSINLNTGVIEIGQGTKTALAQIVSEYFKMPLEKIHVALDVNTSTSPHDWATAASRSLFMAGNATLQACEDAKNQILNTASVVLRCPVQDLTLENEQVFLPDEPHVSVKLHELVLGYTYPNGNSIKGQIIGRGNYISRRISGIDPETGQGSPALEWTLGAQAIEVILDPKDGTYTVTKAASCMDVGRVIHPELAKNQVIGAIAMALGFSKLEGFQFNSRGIVMNSDLRSYKIMRYGDQPDYLIDFLETPQQDGPYGARGLGEQGVIGIPGALANAVTNASGRPQNILPLTYEKVWLSLQEVSI